MTTAAVSTTRWPLVFTLIGAGVICAFQVGKAGIAVPLLRHDLNISLSFAGWIVSAYAVLGAVGGLPFGIGVARLGARRVAIAGLLILGAASCAGAAAPSGIWLFVSRLVEGGGYVVVVLAMPTLLRLVSNLKDRDVVMSTWAAYVPIGMVAMMLTGSLLATAGWRMLWLGNGVLAIAYAAIIALVAPRDVYQPNPSSNLLQSAGEVLRTRGPILLALTFGMYAFHYHALVSMMPTLLIDRLGLSIELAGTLAALTVVANACGNLSAGFLLRMGLPLWLLIAIVFASMGLLAFGIFATAAPAWLVAAFACGSLGLSGAVPGAIFAGAPRYTPRPELLAITLGVIVQASNTGQFLGPATLSGWADRFGWASAPAIFVTMGVTGVGLALMLRRTPSH
jgi:MFS family permease